MAENKRRRRLRPRSDGTYDSLDEGDGSSAYQKGITPETARKMWMGGYDEVPEDDVDFEAARLLAGGDTSLGRPAEVTVQRRGDTENYDITRTFPDGSTMGQSGGRALANALAAEGGERVKLPRPPVANDATFDGASNPQARARQG